VVIAFYYYNVLVNPIIIPKVTVKTEKIKFINNRLQKTFKSSICFNSKVLKIRDMFGLFKKKSEIEILQEKYSKLLGEAHKLSHSDRSASDKKTAEAEEVLKQIEKLR